MPDSTYSTTADLLLGTMPSPSGGVSQKYVNDAADEIDSKLGLRYITPIVVDTNVQANRATTLILKRIANWLASGRMILALSSPEENQVQNAYGAGLVKEATKALDQLANGEFTLPGATFLNADDMGVSGPVISNLDQESNVESFYAMTQIPSWVWPPVPNPIFPAGVPIRNPYTW